MNFKTTIILLIALALVGAWVMIDRFNGGEKPAPRAAGEGVPVFTDLKSADVTAVTIAPAEGEAVKLVKSGGKWRMMAPQSAPAETWQVDALIRELVDLKSRSQVPLSTSAQYGLNSPAFKVELIAGDKSYRLAVGTRSPLGDMMYVHKEGEKTALAVPSDVWEKLASGAEKLRDPKLVSTESSAIQQVVIQRESGELELSKVGGQWRILKPAAMLADESAISDLLFQITGMRADGFVSATTTAPRTGLDHPQVTIWFSTAVPASQPTAAATRPAGTTLAFGNYVSSLRDNVYVRVEEGDVGSVAKVSAGRLESFNKPAIDLREKKVLDIDSEKVSGLTLTAELSATTQPSTRPASRSTLTIERRKSEATLGPSLPAIAPASTQATSAPATAPASTWVFKGASPTEAPDAAVEGLLSRLHPLRAEKFVESPAESSIARYTLSLTGQDAGGAQSTRTEVQFFDRGTSLPPLARAADATFEVDRAWIDEIQKLLEAQPK